MHVGVKRQGLIMVTLPPPLAYFHSVPFFAPHLRYRWLRNLLGSPVDFWCTSHRYYLQYNNQWSTAIQRSTKNTIKTFHILLRASRRVVPLCEMTEVASVAAFLPRTFFENAEQEGKPHLAIWTAFCTTAAHPLHTRRGNGKLSLSENPPSTHAATATADLWILRFPFFCQFVSWPQLQHTNVSFVLPSDTSKTTESVIWLQYRYNHVNWYK